MSKILTVLLSPRTDRPAIPIIILNNMMMIRRPPCLKFDRYYYHRPTIPIMMIGLPPCLKF